MRRHWLWDFLCHPVLGTMTIMLFLGMDATIVLFLVGEEGAAAVVGNVVPVVAVMFGGVCVLVDQVRIRRRARS